MVANGVAGLLYLLVHVVLGRKLDGLEYASFVSLVGLLNVLGLGATALQLTLARFTAEAEGNPSFWTALIRRAFRGGLWWGLAAWVGWSLLALGLVDHLQAPSWWALVLLGLTAVLQLLGPLVNGALQGLRRFGWMATSSIAGAGTRLTTAGLIAMAGGGATQVLVAFVAGAAAALGAGLWPLRRLLASAPSSEEASIILPGQDIRRYFLWVILGQGALFLLINADLVLAARLLSGDALAAYGKAAMLARVVVFLPLPLVIAMFPNIQAG